MADKTVTLDDAEWQQLVAIIANATGFMTFQKLLGQLQAQDRQSVKGDGLDSDPPAEQSGQLPLRRSVRAAEPGR